MKKPVTFKAALVLLPLLLALLALAALPGFSSAKEVSGIGPIRSLQYSTVDDSDTLYLLSDNVFYVIGSDGELKWTYSMPYVITGDWDFCNDLSITQAVDSDGRHITRMSGGMDPAIAASNGTIYAYLIPSSEGTPTDHYHANGMLVAISNGRVLWELPLESRAVRDPFMMDDDGRFQMSDARITVKGDMIYVFHDANETSIGKDGTILWNLEDVASQAIVGDDGILYCVRAAPADMSSYDPQLGDLGIPGLYVDRDTSNTVDAFYPNGTLYWERQTTSPPVRQADLNYADLVYNNYTIYVPMHNGITAIGEDGRVKWSKTYDLGEFAFDNKPGVTGTLRLYRLMQFDSDGNLYLQCTSNAMPVGVSFNSDPMYLIVIGPDGRELSRSYVPASKYTDVQDGVAYITKGPTGYYTPDGVTDLPSQWLFAVDVKSGRDLWNATFSPTNITVVTVDEGSAYTLFGYNATIETYNLAHGAYKDTRPVIPMTGELGVTRGKDIIYVTYEPLNYENPVVFGQSKCAYSGGIYAFSTSGMPLWFQPVDLSNQTRQQQWVSKNGTVFYLTPDGRVGVLGVGAAAGLTLAALYAFYHFFLVGAVARAKSRLNTNENRNRILGFIASNPGSTLYEIARGTNLNLGTVKYHAFILGMNHKIVPSRTDGKYVRYFTNSGSYTKDEQLVLSLMRRDTIGKILGLILEKPGISNIEIARELGVTESVVSRCIKELDEKGVIARAFDDARSAYTVREAYAGPIADAVKRLQGQ